MSKENVIQQPVTATSSNNVTPPQPSEEDEKMRSILAKKEQELLMLQRKKVEMELEQMRRQVEMAEKTVKKVSYLYLFNIICIFHIHEDSLLYVIYHSSNDYLGFESSSFVH